MYFEEIFQQDYERKMQMKRYADDRYMKTSDIQVGDLVLMKLEQPNKPTPPYEDGGAKVQVTGYRSQ